MSDEPVTLFCLSSYEKGQDFLRGAAAEGARVFLLTVESLQHAVWPRETLADLLVMPALDNVEHVTNGVTYFARQNRIDRIVALDEFDMELAAALREHLRLPGMTVSATRAVRDKLVMRELAAAAGINGPAFTRIAHHGDLARFMDRTPAPWVLKPRMQASAIGIRMVHGPAELWPLLDQLGDLQSHHLLERYIPGSVWHVDGIVVDGAVRFAEVHQYQTPPFDVMHGGGIFCSRTVRDGDDERRLHALLSDLVAAVGVRNSVVHAEFIRARETGEFHFLEIAARVGGAHIADMVEAATGVNLWREWARLEVAQARGTSYEPPQARSEHAGVLISLARQEWPDLSGYDDPEVVWRMKSRHHAGLIVRSPDAERVRHLLDQYLARFHEDFYTSLPAPDKPTH